MPAFNREAFLEVAKIMVPLLLAGISYYVATTVAPIDTRTKENKEKLTHVEAQLSEAQKELILIKERNARLEVELRAADKDRRDMQISINNLYIKMAVMEGR